MALLTTAAPRLGPPSPLRIADPWPGFGWPFPMPRPADHSDRSFERWPTLDLPFCGRRAGLMKLKSSAAFAFGDSKIDGGRFESFGILGIIAMILSIRFDMTSWAANQPKSI
jgi:hypothetical protein